MRALDDIKETVRKAALTAWRSFSSVCNRLVDGTHAPESQAQEVLDVLLPTLVRVHHIAASLSMRIRIWQSPCTSCCLGCCVSRDRAGDLSIYPRIAPAARVGCARARVVARNGGRACMLMLRPRV